MGDVLTFSNPGHLLPTLRGKVSGVVGHTPPKTWTVQCAVCFTCATGPLIFAVNWANFTPEWHGASEPSSGAPLRYRRCVDCQKARKHPEPTLFDLKEA